MDKRIIDVLSFGRARNYDTAIALYDAGLLKTLFAGGYLKKYQERAISRIVRYFPINKLRRVALRNSDFIPDEYVYPIWRHLLKFPFLKQHIIFKDHKYFSYIAGKLSTSKIILAEQTEALEAFRLAKDRGVITVLMMTGQTPVGRVKWLNDEFKIWNFLTSKSTNGFLYQHEVISREEEEFKLADIILSPSNFVSDSFKYYKALNQKKIFRVNWPILSVDKIATKPKRIDPKRKTRILFVGLLSLGKGIMYLTSALEKFSKNQYEAFFVGGIDLSNDLKNQCARVAELKGFVPFSELHQFYEWADIFVFPTLSEGRARVVLEAMAQGIPCITTYNSGAPIINKENGLFIECRNIDAIVEAINLMRSDQDLYTFISKNAINTMANMTLRNYKMELTSAIMEGEIEN